MEKLMDLEFVTAFIGGIIEYYMELVRRSIQE